MCFFVAKLCTVSLELSTSNIFLAEFSVYKMHVLNSLQGGLFAIELSTGWLVCS